MRRFLLATSIVLALAVTVRAADTAPDVQRQYSTRVVQMADTAAAHIELARWCEANGLADRARVHWQEAVSRDPDNKEARAALGQVWRNMQWVPAKETAPADGVSEASDVSVPAAPADPTFGERRRELARQIQSIVTTNLGTMDPAAREDGRRQLLMLRDAAAAEPAARILGAGNEEMRLLACEVLGQLPGKEAAQYLVKFALTDNSEAVYKASVAALKQRSGNRGVQQFVNALASEKALPKAAYALGEIGDPAAVPALISRLQVPQTKVLKAPAPAGSGSGSSGAYLFSGTIVTYVADAEPVVGNGAVGWDLKIGAVPVGTTLSVQNPRVYIYRTIIEFVRQPVVREALQKMSGGQDFEFNANAWRDWFARNAAGPVPTP